MVSSVRPWFEECTQAEEVARSGGNRNEMDRFDIHVEEVEMARVKYHREQFLSERENGTADRA